MPDSGAFCPSLLTLFLPHRDHPASEVYVTGTFDDWGRSVQLEKKGDGFQKLVELPVPNEKIYYKVRLAYVSVIQGLRMRFYLEIRPSIKASIKMLDAIGCRLYFPGFKP